MSTELAGTGVVVTRPAHQAARLCALIEARGGRPWPFPVIEIAPPRDPEAARRVLARLPEADLAVFISANAAERGVAAARAALGAFPEGPTVAAVGRATARALEAAGVRVSLVPRGRFDSEGLLALPELAPHRVAGRRVVIFRGEGGRETLARTLRARGATVEYAEVYRRVRPQADPAPLLAAWAAGGIHAVVVTSGEGLRNLWEMVGPAGRAHLVRTVLVAVSERVVQLARELGFEAPVLLAPEAGDEAVVETLCRWRAGTPARG